VAVTGRRKDVTPEIRNPEEKTRFGKYAKAAWGRVGCTGEVVACRGAGLARADRASWAGSCEKIQRKKYWFLNLKWIRILARIWEILQGDLEGIWTWGFFLNSSRLLKDF
jgi:hypothetical protein